MSDDFWRIINATSNAWVALVVTYPIRSAQRPEDA